MQLHITQPAKGKKVTAELFDGGKPVYADKLDLQCAKDVNKLVRQVTERGYQLTSERVLELRHGGEMELMPLPAAAPAANAAPLRIVRRKRHQQASAGTVFASLEDALAGGADDDFLEWDNIEQLAVLDVDYHDLPLERRPEDFQLETLALIVRPNPKMFWVSKGRGLHLVYEPVDGLTAEEAAACGGLHVKQLDPKCTFEVIARTSYPPGGSVWS